MQTNQPNVLKINFLGTGTSQGVPVIGCRCPVCISLDFRDKRLRSSIHISTAGKSFIIDSGPDFRQQVLRAGIHQLDALIFTHEHKDHTAGMDDVRAYNFLQQKDMPVYAKAEVINSLKQEFAYIFNNHSYPGVPRIEVHEIDKTPFEIEGVPFIPIEVMHFKLPIFGYRIHDFTYITDAKSIAPAEFDKIRGSRVVVLNGLQFDHHLSHLTFDEAVAMLEELKPELGLLTHISHKLGTHSEVQKKLPPFIQLAYDGLEITL